MSFDRLETKLDKIIDTLGEQSNTLTRHGVLHEQNAKELAFHIASHNLLKRHMDAEHAEINVKLETALQPLKWVKLTVKIAAGAASIYGLIKLIGVK